MRHQPCRSLLAPDPQTGFVDMTESPVLASQFRPVAQFWLERYLDTVGVMGGRPPKMNPGECVYVVYKRKLIGYALLVEVVEVQVKPYRRYYALIREGGAVAVTIDQVIPGFRGFRYRWWDVKQERAFPEWKDLA